ncbi:hypothetical protein [Parasulfitobacter algicola]|uniref:Uncharacterized protein n=1 Tax=Parasulfitobacter algicola TaxID=2614809 RepID=A0ABX2IT90_9RHOB|nr:hypothetical protein [Sulfitobacter algicola]NSX55226.1 hypothetical protein [Sulfitobacter algicola]
MEYFFWIIAIISALTIALAIVRVKQTRGTERGSLPGKGDHIIEADYSSGMGGGHHTQYRVPKDPQEYAKMFVPKEK